MRNIRFASVTILLSVFLPPHADGQIRSFATIIALRASTGGLANQYANVAGYRSAGDGGGGQFYTGSPATTCGDVSTSTVNWYKNNHVVAVSPIGLSSGMALKAATTGLLQYDTITRVSVGSITLALAPYQDGSGSLIFTGDNGGSEVKDSSTPTPICWFRATYTYSPKEWGAYMDGSNDDAVFLQNWISAAQPHIAVPGNAFVREPLACGVEGTTQGIIQGSPTQAVAEDNSILPTFYITADPTSTYFSGVALLTMLNSHCAIHGVGLIADGSGNYDTVDAMAKSNLIDGHSYLSGGYYNVKAPSSSSGGANLEIYDSSLNNSVSDNANIGTPNVKLVRNSFAGAGGGNIDFSGSDVLISDNIIQQAASWGVNLHSARSARISANYFDNNGKATAGTDAIQIRNSGDFSICGNTFRDSAAASEGSTSAPYAAHIYFSGTDDSGSLCGNVYLPFHSSGSGSGSAGSESVLIHPDYVYDADTAAILSNIVIDDNPAPQNVGLFSPAAAPVLRGSNRGQVAVNSITGLTLSNYCSTPPCQTVMIAPGTASDSTNGTLINLTSACYVNLGASTKGQGALDSGTVAHKTTYYFFVISGPGGTNPNCIASQNLVPTFKNVGAYKVTVPAMFSSGLLAAYNVGQSGSDTLDTLAANPLGGMAVNNAADPGSYGAGKTTITSLQSYSTSLSATPTAANSAYLTVGSISALGVGMLVAGTQIPSTSPPTVIQALNPSGCTAPCIQITNATLGGTTSFTLTASGNFSITLASAATNSTTLYSPANLDVYQGLYRLVGALYTDNGSDVITFKQDGDTFYLFDSVDDIKSSICPIGDSAAHSCQLSVPCGRNAACATGQGVQVEAFGRTLGGDSTGANFMLLTSLDQDDQAPASFPSAPGYTTFDPGGSTAATFRLATDLDTTTGNSTGSVRVRVAGSSGATVYEVTDGWVFNRAAH